MVSCKRHGRELKRRFPLAARSLLLKESTNGFSVRHDSSEKGAVAIAIRARSFVLVVMRWNASHSPGFRFARDRIEASTALQARSGKVSDVSLPIFSRYSAHYGVGYSKIHMELAAKGDRGSPMWN